MAKNTAFISDLHLSPNTPGITKLFYQFIEELNENTEAIYILGDFFQYWAGDDDQTKFNEEIKTLLKKVSNKIPVYLMVGNRDFLLGKKFAKEAGAILISDPSLINLYGKNIMLSHGDTIFIGRPYKIFRTIIRLPWATKLFLKLPLNFRLKIAATLQKYSSRNGLFRNNNRPLTHDINCLNQLLADSSASLLIHGHIHLATIKELLINNRKVQIISLGVWGGENNLLLYHEDGSFAFKTLL